MTKFYQTLLATVAIATLAGCSKYDEADVAPGTGNTGKTVKIYADVTEQDKTRADITVGDTSFSAAWEDSDNMGVLATAPSTATTLTAEKFVYSITEQAFSATPTWSGKGAWKYYAFAPYAEVAAGATTVSIPFGNLREQTGTKFNSNFDALVATPRQITDADPGMTDDGKAIAFKLNRLTPILHLALGGSKTEKVKALLLTSPDNQPISAATLDFDAAQGEAATAALSTTDASNVIAVTYPTDAPAANAAKGIFNIPAGQYNKLTLEVITEDNQIGTVELIPNKAFDAGTLYNKALTVANFKAIDKPAFTWEEDMNIEHDITTCGTDYQANIKINAPGGIGNLVVNITSEVLNAPGNDPDQLHLSQLDIFNDKKLTLAPDMEMDYAADLGLSSSTLVQYKKSADFNITNLVPLIAMLSPTPGSLHIFEVVVTDLAGQTTTQALTFKMPGKVIYNNDTDFWKNTGTLTIKDLETTPQSISLDYRVKGETNWEAATVTASTNNTWIASVEPTWTPGTNPSGHTIYTVDPNTGIFAKKSYEYKLTVDGVVIEESMFTPANNNGDTIPAFTDSSMSCFTESNTNATFWGSGNNSMAKTLCKYDSSYAKMLANGIDIIGIKALAPGNLFTGTFTFVKSGFLGASSYGTVGFGQPYTYTARPTALQLNYKLSFNNTFFTKWPHTNELTSGHDQASIIVAIVNWDARHNVKSGNDAAPTGSWNPETLVGLSDTEKAGLIAYGVVYPEQDAANDTVLNIPLNYYNKDAGIPTGNYSIVIGCSTSRYGDYLNGTVNTFYTKDFRWVY